MERVKYNGTIKPNLATNSSAKSFIVSVDPNSNSAVSWDTGYHFNDVNTVAPVHSNGLTSSKIVSSYASSSDINNAGGWNATQYNEWNLTGFANAQIDPYDFHGSPYDPIGANDLTIIPGSSSRAVFGNPGYAGPPGGYKAAYYIQPAGSPGNPWAIRAFTATPYYFSSLLDPLPSTIYHDDVSPSIPKAQNLYMSNLLFPDSITCGATVTRTVSNYSVASGYTVSNVSLSPFRMMLAVINNKGNWEYCHIPLHVTSGGDFTFKKNSNNNNKFELKDTITFKAYLDRECLRACQNYLKAGISSGLFDGSTKRYYPMLSWEPPLRFPYLSSGGTGVASLGNAVLRVTWSVYNYDHSKYQVSNIEQIR